jgi:lactocepin
VYFRNTLTTGIADFEFIFGNPGDRLVAGAWGRIDGTDTPGLFRPSNTTFFFRQSNTQGNADSQFIWGQPGWLPVSGVFGTD